METKLIDFSFDELNWLYLTLEEKRKDIENKFELIENMDDSQLRNDLYGQNAIHYAKCNQFMTKVGEAQKVVNARDIMSAQN